MSQNNFIGVMSESLRASDLRYIVILIKVTRALSYRKIYVEFSAFLYRNF